MSQAKKLERLKKSGILASWEWPQERWNEIALLYRHCTVNWKSPLVAWLFFSAFLLLKHGIFIKHKVNVFTSPLIWGILIGLLLLLLGIYYLAHTMTFPKIKVGHKPIVIISKDGVLLGEHFLFLNSPNIQLSTINLIKPETVAYPYTIRIQVQWGLGAETFIIPVPTDKVTEAEKVVTSLSATINVEPS